VITDSMQRRRGDRFEQDFLAVLLQQMAAIKHVSR
jgi:hypothetical protein